jgi:tetratricopeptide (TPR) repeat protein
VKNVIVKLDDLINQIQEDQKSRIIMEEPLSIKIYHDSEDADQSTTGLNGHFVHSLLLIDVLIRMKFSETDKQDLILLCQNEYKNNSTQLAIIHQFETEYSPDNALWWYTRDSFLYRMLNKALRIQNIDLLFLFRFVIGDIYQQLTRNQCQSYVLVYRGQVISNDELNSLRRSIGKFISTTSFFSTSINRHEAITFLNSSDISNDLYRVLFIINADPCVVKSKSFADISSFSDLSIESEVLFMIGCVFHLINIHYDDVEQIWMIRMELCDDDEHDLKKLFNYLKKEYGCGENEVNLCSFGNLLHRMGKYDLAEKIYYRVLVQLQSNDPSLSDLCYSLGMVSKDKNEYDYSLECFKNSLEIILRTNPSNYIGIGGLYCCIGNVHVEKGNDNKAMECYNKAIESYSQVHAANYSHMAAVYNGIANIYCHQKQYTQALHHYKLSLILQEEYLSFDHSDIAMNLDSIGVVYRHLGEYDLAMSYHNQSIEIRLKSLPPQHPDIAINYKNIGLLHEVNKEWKQALIYYQKAAIIYCYALSSEHPHMIKIEKDIQRVSSLLK